MYHTKRILTLPLLEGAAWFCHPGPQRSSLHDRRAGFRFRRCQKAEIFLQRAASALIPLLCVIHMMSAELTSALTAGSLGCVPMQTFVRHTYTHRSDSWLCGWHFVCKPLFSCLSRKIHNLSLSEKHFKSYGLFHTLQFIVLFVTQLLCKGVYFSAEFSQTFYMYTPLLSCICYRGQTATLTLLSVRPRRFLLPPHEWAFRVCSSTFTVTYSRNKAASQHVQFST